MSTINIRYNRFEKLFCRLFLISLVMLSSLFEGCNDLSELRKQYGESDKVKVDPKGVTKVSIGINYSKTRGGIPTKINEGWLVIFRFDYYGSYDDFVHKTYWYGDFYVEKLIKLEFNEFGQPTNLKDISVQNGRKAFILCLNECPVDLNDFNADLTPKTKTIKNKDKIITISDITKPTDVFTGSYYFKDLTGGAVNFQINMDCVISQLNLHYVDPGKQVYYLNFSPSSYYCNTHPDIYLEKSSSSYQKIGTMTNGTAMNYIVKYKVEIKVPNKINITDYRVKELNINADFDDYEWYDRFTGVENGELNFRGYVSNSNTTIIKYYEPLNGNKTDTFYPANLKNFECRHYIDVYSEYAYKVYDPNPQGDDDPIKMWCVKDISRDRSKFYRIGLDPSLSQYGSSDYCFFTPDFFGHDRGWDFPGDYKLLSIENIIVNSPTPNRAHFKNINFFVNNSCPPRVSQDKNIQVKDRTLTPK